MAALKDTAAARDGGDSSGGGWRATVAEGKWGRRAAPVTVDEVSEIIFETSQYI